MTDPTDQQPLNLDTIHLDSGNHNSPAEGHCLLEVVSMFAREPFTDHPACVSPYLRNFGISLNDRVNDQQRQDLKRFIPLLIGTAGDGLDEQRRDAVYKETYTKVRAVYEERFDDLIAESWTDALSLFERLINPALVSA